MFADVAVPGGPVAVRHAARDILSRPEFQPTPESPLQRLRNWFFHQLERILGSVVSGGTHGLLGAALALAFVTAVVLLVVGAVRSVSDGPTRRGFVLDGPPRSARDWRAEAEAGARRGDWRGVLRCRYRALVAELARLGLVEEIDGRTTGEYRRSVAAALPGAAPGFDEITDVFERTWYGGEPADADDAARIADLADAMLARTR